MILENHAWACTCGQSFEEPEGYASHATSAKNSGSPAVDHKPLGYVDLDTGEQAVSFNFRIWKGKWKGQLDRKYERGQLSHEIVTVNTVETEEDGGEESEEQETTQPVGSGETQEVPVTQKNIKGKRNQISGMAKVQFRPKVYDMDESIIHLYNLFLGSMRSQGIDYTPSLGEWMRDVIFQHFFEHPEMVDLSSLLTPQEKEMLSGMKEQYATAKH